MKSYKKSTFFDIKSTFFFKLLISLFQLCIFRSQVGNQIDRRTEDDMLKEDAIMLVVTSAMARYASENNGKRGLSRDAVIDAVVSFGGDINDVKLAMMEGLRRISTYS